MEVTYILPREKAFYTTISLIPKNRLFIETKEQSTFSWQLAEDRDWDIEYTRDVSVDGIESTEIHLSCKPK